MVRFPRLCIAVLIPLTLFSFVSQARSQENLSVQNGDFRTGTLGEVPPHWSWWSRTGAGKAELVEKDSRKVAKIEHDGPRDFAFSNATTFSVRPGQMYRATAEVLVEQGSVELAIVARHDGELVAWSLGSDGVGAQSSGDSWRKMAAVCEVPEGANEISLRFIGQEDTEAWIDDVGLSSFTFEQQNLPRVEGFAKNRVTEKLDRALIARRVGNQLYLSWRLLAEDPQDVSFHVYRLDPRSGSVKRVNESPIRRTTDFVTSYSAKDERARWCVLPASSEAPDRKAFDQMRFLQANADPSEPLQVIPLKDADSFQMIAIADLQGDGRYDYVIKQPGDNIDPYEKYWKPSPDTYKLQAYDHAGRFLWEYDMGWSIERGIWYSPYVVYDFNGDGKAEVALKGGEGDPRSEDGRVRQGPEYLLLLDGETGKQLTRVDWPSREGFGDMQARGYNYSSRNQLGVAYLDGKTPCLIVARGTYNLMKAEAWMLQGNRLIPLWKWDNEGLPRKYQGQGAHWMHCADIDSDGRDEVLLGSLVLDDNGGLLWSTGLGHPDHFYLGDLDPRHPGWEIYYGIETRRKQNGMCMVDAKSGALLWGHENPTRHIHAKGLCSDILAEPLGWECYSGERDYPDDRFLRDCRGNLLAKEDLGGLSPIGVYWDSDLQREVLRGKTIYAYPEKEALQEVPGRWTGTVDLLGDWREELVVSAEGEIRIYATTIPAGDRRTCLMQDPIYRNDVAHQSMGYRLVPCLSYDPVTRSKKANGSER
jgi:rhamnogalacturonan endolyase